MKTRNKNRLGLLSCLIAFSLISCTKDPDDLFIHSTIPHDRELPVEAIQPGIYKGEALHLGSGIAYSWMEFKAADLLDKVGMVIPIKELVDHVKANAGVNNATSIEMNMPEMRGKQIFDRTVVTYSSEAQNKSTLKFPHVKFNFYSSNSPYRCPLDCEPEHARSKIPSGYTPLPADEGCIIGLGLLWIPEAKSFEGDQVDILLGSANDDLSIYSPMASVEVLANHPDHGGDIPLPSTMTSSRYYPTQYRIRQMGSDLYITLEQFVQKP